MRNVLKTLASLTLAVAFVASRIPCWGPNYQPKAPKPIK